MPAEFGAGTAFVVIVASMVGVGVLTTSGLTVYHTQSNQLMLVLWVVGGLIAICGALSLAELAAALPRSGGDYVYLYEAYGPLAAFLSGWVSFVLGFAAPSALAALQAASFLLAPLQLSPEHELTPQRIMATLVIVAFAAIHLSGRRRTAHVQGAITTFTALFLIAFALAGLAIGFRGFRNFADAPPLTASVAHDMFFSLVYVMYAYVGWNSAAYLAGEMVEPQRELPRAILVGTGAVVVLYLALNVVYGLALPSSEIRALVTLGGTEKAVEPVAHLAALRLFGPRWSTPLTLVMGVMLLSTLGAYILTGPRVLYAMAVAGQFPSIAGRLGTRDRVPAVATAMQVACALVLLWTGTFHRLIVYASVGLGFFSILTISAVYVLRRTRPDLPRPFRTPGYPVTPAIYIVLTGAVTAAAFLKKPWESSLALASIVGGVPLFYLWRFAARGRR
jgi:APA family basic amino acid/polyamine antiporter